MTNQAPTAFQGRCMRCEAIIPVDRLANHRREIHSRLKQALHFEALCPECGSKSRSRSFKLFAGEPIEHVCGNGHQYLSQPLVVRYDTDKSIWL